MFFGLTFAMLIFGVPLVPTTDAADFETLHHLRSKASPAEQKAAVEGMLARLIGTQSSMFPVRIDSYIGPPFRDTFQLKTTGKNQVTITGTSGVAAAMGFYYYIKNYCGCQYTWAGENLRLPYILPDLPSGGIQITSNDQFRYYQNVCTVSYSFVWWDWARWQREIDWMALQGINLPLAFTGQEAIFSRVYMSMGFTWKDVEEHFGGPAFLAWARMGNIHGWGGPLPLTWINNQLILQHKILNRMRSLGMIPVLPGFAGHVPAAITRVFPKANVTRLRRWSNFGANYSETYLLDFSDPLFKKIGGSFITAMQNEFGIDHIYNADTFNEMEPKSSEPSYLASASKAVYGALVAGDPKAIWLMQGWLFMARGFWKPPQIKALLTGVPRGKMIILDLQAELAPVYERTESFYGQPFIWCMLHNFGGTMELYGALDNINTGPFVGRKFANSTMVGTGLTPEGINQNEVIYEFMNENAWRKQPRNISDWISSFHHQRYGMFDENAESAWQALKSSVYNYTDGYRGHGDSVTVTSLPKLTLRPNVWYKPETLFEAWDSMVKAAAELGDSSLFRYDLVDVTRNSLQIASMSFYHDLVMAYSTNNSVAVLSAGTNIVDLLADLDMLLASDDHFLLGNWVEAAKKFAGLDIEEAILYIYNAKNQVTLWGPNGEILDYAAKQWSGLINDYYKQRWLLFVDMLLESLKQQQPFNQKTYDKEVFLKVEQPFTFSVKDYPTTTTGDSIKIATALHSKWRPKTHSVFLKHFEKWSAMYKNNDEWESPLSRYRSV